MSKDDSEAEDSKLPEAIQVFRESEIEKKIEVSVKKKKVKVKRRLNEEERHYYTHCCEKFKEEIKALTKISAFFCLGILIACSLLNPFSDFLVLLCFLFLGMAAISFLGVYFLGILGFGYFSRFVVLASQSTRLDDRKRLLSFFSQGYVYKQNSKLLWAVGIANLAIFFFVFVFKHSFYLGLILVVCALFVGYLLYLQKQQIENPVVANILRKPCPVLEEDISNVFPGSFLNEEEEKLEFNENLVLSGLLSLLKNESTKVRKDTIKALSKIKTPQAVQAMLTTLGDPNPEIRAQAIALLGKNKEENARDSIQCLFHDESSEVRAAVVEALGHLRDESSLDIVMAALEDAHPEVRGAAAEALGRIEKKNSLKTLVSKLKDRDWFVRYKASVALGKMPSDLDFDAIENLTKTLLDENEYVSSTSEHILRKVIETMAKNDPLYEEITKNLKKKNPDEDKMRTISKKIFKEDPTALKKEDTSLKKLPLAKEIPLILKEETKKIPLDKETSKEEKKIFGEDTPGSESLD